MEDKKIGIVHFKTYLDGAATTKVHPDVLDAMQPYFTSKFHNPSSLYSNAIKVKQDIEAARKTVADFIRADQEEIYFTSSGSESNCWAIRGWIDKCIADGHKDIVVITSPIEHKSIMSFHVANVPKKVTFATVNVDEYGYVDDFHLEELLRKYSDCKVLVSIQVANNEIGTIQRIGRLSWLTHKYGAVFHTDAVQAFGHIPISVKSMGIDMLSASGHKIEAPKGIGILYKSKDIEIEPLIYGSQMDGMRGGTENVPYIIGFAKAVELIEKHMKDTNCDLELECCRTTMFRRLKSIGCKLVGPVYMRLSNNLTVMLPEGVGAEEMLYMLDTAEIEVSTGSACNSHSKQPSHVLKAIGLTDEECARCLRITLTDAYNYVIIDKVICEIERNIKLFA